MTPQANELLNSWIRDTDSGLEFGSGRSTVWFARRCGKLTSVEHNPDWYQAVTKRLNEQQLINVDYHLFPRIDDADSRSSQYVKVAERFGSGELDFVLVDGIYRDACVAAVLDKIRRDGILIIDNVHLYFPSDSRSPNAIKVGEPPASDLWRQALDQLGNWRRIWTSNHVSDTAIFIRN
ncbi:MAG: hypothetical protein HPY76_15160 [Anaerolineae bacterium]|nr:hypothetical protein [Anaerolineae bacterium]NPV57992.1 hypothetical protein [Anaerolineae bacterium]